MNPNVFSCPDPPPTVRQLTKRVQNSSATATKEKSRGCAFLEFSKASGLQSALRLHHSVLDGRIINVELSAGGGGNSASRVKKLKVKNAKLDVSTFRSSSSQHNADVDYRGIDWGERTPSLTLTNRGPLSLPWPVKCDSLQPLAQSFSHRAKRRGRSPKATRRPQGEDNAIVVKKVIEKSSQTVGGQPGNSVLSLPRLVRMQSL